MQRSSYMGPIWRSLALILSYDSKLPFNNKFRSALAFRLATETGNSRGRSFLDMANHKPRSRMISVRLCEEEYEALQHLCAVNGARNLSDFAREAMQAHLNDLSPENARSNGTNEFEAQLSRLDQKIDELFKMIMSSIAELKS